jgi:hypothetical protein
MRKTTTKPLTLNRETLRQVSGSEAPPDVDIIKYSDVSWCACSTTC